jgi:two-component sensor histidine kinase
MPNRQNILNNLELLSVGFEDDFNDICLVAKEICDSHTAMVNIISENDAIFKGSVGFKEVEFIERHNAVCSITVERKDIYVVKDLSTEDLTKNLPYIQTSPYYKFYAGVPLIGKSNFVYGALCVVDFNPRPQGLNERQTTCLWALSRQVVKSIETRDFTHRQAILKTEIAHRMKNMFSLIQSIVGATLRKGCNLEEAKTVMYARFHALSRANDILIRKTNSSTIKQIVYAMIDLYDGEQISEEGPDITISARSAVSLSLILHELSTNSIKYGALSTDSGQVSITWWTTPTMFHFKWIETGGPSIAMEPSQRGFGSTLIGMGLSVPGSQGTSTYEASGLVYSLEAPLGAI